MLQQEAQTGEVFTEVHIWNITELTNLQEKEERPSDDLNNPSCVCVWPFLFSGIHPQPYFPTFPWE